MNLTSKIYPILPLRDIVIFPYMIAPLFVGRLKSINALETVMEENTEIVLLTQKKSSTEEPSSKDLFKMGTLGTILQMLKLPDGTVKVLVEGKFRCEINEIISSDDYLSAKLNVLKKDISLGNNDDEIINQLKNSFERFSKLNSKINSDVLSTISNIDNSDVLSDTIVNHLVFSIDEKQSFLEMTDASERVKALTTKIEKEIESGKLMDPASIDPATGMPLEDPNAMGEVPEEETGPGGVESIAPADYKRGEF